MLPPLSHRPEALELVEAVAQNAAEDCAARLGQLCVARLELLGVRAVVELHGEI